MKEEKKKNFEQKSAEKKEEQKVYVAKFGKNGKEISVKCVRGENGKFVGINGEEIPDWADFEF